MRRSVIPVLTTVLLSFACASDGPAAEGGGSATEDTADDDDGGTEAGTGVGTTGESNSASNTGPTGSGSTTQDPDGSTSTGDTGEAVDVPARGVRISRVEANPGVAVPVAVGGDWVEGAERNGQIPKLRNTAFRVYLNVDEDIWVLRELEARVTVTQTDGSENVYSAIGEVANDSSESSLQSNLLVGVLAEAMEPGAQFQVELFEAGGDYQGLPAENNPPTAMAEKNFIGIEPTPQNMRIMLVPIAYNFGGCDTLVDTSEEGLAPYEDAMFQQNGLETIEITVHDPFPVTDLDLTTGNGFFSLLPRISSLRASEAPDPNVYYYGLFDNCNECIGDASGCTLGVANGIPGDTMGEAGARAAIGTQFLSGDEVGIETFVHEVGHNQGRRHIACPGGNAAGPDITYPHEDGKIGVWGFGVRDFQVRNASTHTDYMSYCNPTWVSDWQWRETFERIRTLSSWDAADIQREMEGSFILTGAYNTETGESQWWTDRGAVAADDADQSFALGFVSGDAVLENAELVDVDPWSEGPWVTVRVPLPDNFDDVTELRVQGPGSMQTIEASRVTRYHGGGFQTP